MSLENAYRKLFWKSDDEHKALILEMLSEIGLEQLRAELLKAMLVPSETGK